MDFMTVNLSSPVPLYTQISEQIRMMVEDGTLNPGDALPSIRLVASQLGIANNTVARAYRDLESAGIIESNGRKGSFISRTYSRDKNPLLEPLKELIQKGLTFTEIKELFYAALETAEKGEVK